MSQYRRLRLLNLGERLLVKFSCRNHNWSMPFTLPGHSYPTLDGIAYDSHRTCVDCSVSQLYNSRSFTPGPLFEDVIPNVERVPVVA
jgi:hypothetical protein